MAKYYFYKLTVDDGGAPCVENALLSLAICKPYIRQTATIGDFVFGFAAKCLHTDNRLIYVASIANSLRNGDYYKTADFAGRRDCIYLWDNRMYRVKRDARFHGSLAHLYHDLGTPPEYPRANVLISDDFRYFGGSLPENYKQQFPQLRQAIESLRQGHRVFHSARLRENLEILLRQTFGRYPRNLQNAPSQNLQRERSHRSEGCGVACSDIRH
jgi:hypothetical protein